MLDHSRNEPIERPRISALHKKLLSPSSPRPLSPVNFWVAASALAVLVVGCGIFDPGKCDDCGGGDDVAPYPPLDSPARVVLNVKFAWEKRDSSRVEAIYADGYQGTSTDLGDPGSGTLFFAKSDEVRAVGGLKLDTDVTSVSVTFKDTTSWIQERRPGDPPDWVSVVVRDPQIFIGTSSTNDLIVKLSKTFTFKARPDTAAAGNWQIVRWDEVHEAGP